MSWKGKAVFAAGFLGSCGAVAGVLVLTFGSSTECDGCMVQRLQLRRLRIVEPGPLRMPPGFSDADDLSNAPYVLEAAELSRMRLRPKRQGLVQINPNIFKALRSTPVLKVRIHAIRTANSDGSEAATITSAQVKQLVDQSNLVWWASGIEFLYDPAADFEHRNNTLLNQDCSHAQFNQNVTNASWDPATSDNTANHNARTNVGNSFPKKIVMFFRYGTKFTWDDAAKKWTRGPSTGGFSSSQNMYVAMSRQMPEKNLMGHEVGHYLHLPHTHVGGIDTVAKAAKAIKDWVDVSGKTTQTALQALDGDRSVYTDTPSDCGGGIFVSKYGEGANCDASYPIVQIPVKFNSGYQAYYTLKPDKLNIMSYFKHCHALGTHHLSKAQIDRARAALQTGNRKVLIS